MGAILEVDNLTAGYGNSPIIHNVSMRTHQGNAVAIIGPNGAGKSTLLKSILGLVSIFSGVIKFKGEAIQGSAPERLVDLGLGYVPQSRNVFPSLTVAENLEIGAYLRPKTVREHMKQVYDMFPDLARAARRPAGTLSGGQRNMLAVGRALMTNPDVLLLDEPTAGLSPGYTKVVWEHIMLVAKTGKCVVVVEQNASTALHNAHWAYVLTAGQNREDGPGREVLLRPDIGEMFLGR